MTNKAIPKITVRIDRGEDWVELVGDSEESAKTPVICGSGELEWLDYIKLMNAWHEANEAVIE